MTKPVILLLVFCLCLSVVSEAIAQTSPPTSVSSKFDARLKHRMYEERVRQAKASSFIADPMMTVIFRSTSPNIQPLVQQYGGIIHSDMGLICTAELPLSRINDFASEPDIVCIQSASSVKFTNDTARRLIGADKVNAGLLPGGTPYTGKGVLIGLVDSGIDFLHPDFRKSGDTTQTRIVSIWDQNDSSATKPVKYNYGADWTESQIDAEIVAPGKIKQRDVAGHGTHVSGSAAGLRGIAPDAQICMVALKNDSNGTAHMLDGINYIFQQAAERNMPCVVNLSVGTQDEGGHNGNSLLELAIEYLTAQRKGFIVCVAAGNDGESTIHNGGYALGKDSSWFYCNSFKNYQLYHINKSIYDDSIWVSVCMDSIAMNYTDENIIHQTQVYQTPWMQVRELKQLTGGASFDALYGNGESAGQVTFVCSSIDSLTTDMIITTRNLIPYDKIPLNSRANLFRILYKGAGTFHTWGSGDAVLSAYNSTKNSNFRSNDNNYTILVPATGRSVLCVGAFVNKSSFVNIQGKKITDGTPAGALAHFTSIGPTTDGRLKPDFCAPGLNVASSKSQYSPVNNLLMVDTHTIVLEGTSMACPMTCGAVALYLQRSPTATFDEVKNAFMSNAETDSLTRTFGALPNNRWGNGRLNIFKTMGGVSYVNEEQGAQNSDITVSVFPSPGINTVTFSLSKPSGSAKLKIYDLNGNTVAEILMKDSVVHLDTSTWAKGVYYFSLSGIDQKFSGRFVVE